MIDGELYALVSAPDCVFAYCKKGSCMTSFYIGVCSSGDVLISGPSLIRGMAGNSTTTKANETQRLRFFTAIKEKGYHYNEVNKAVFKDGERIII